MTRRQRVFYENPDLQREKQSRYAHAMRNGFQKDYCSSTVKRFSPDEIKAYEEQLLKK